MYIRKMKFFTLTAIKNCVCTKRHKTSYNYLAFAKYIFFAVEYSFYTNAIGKFYMYNIFAQKNSI